MIGAIKMRTERMKFMRRAGRVVMMTVMSIITAVMAMRMSLRGC